MSSGGSDEHQQLTGEDDKRATSKKWSSASWNPSNLSSIVSQGLEQVSKLKDDMEKQMDVAVGNAPSVPAAFLEETISEDNTTELKDDKSSNPPPPSSALLDSLRAKELQVAQLLEEGTVLSKTQGVLEARIKSLRKECESTRDEKLRLESSLEKSNIKCTELKAELKSQSSKLSAATDESKKVSAERDEVQNQLDITTKCLEDTKADSERTNSALEELKASHEQLGVAYEELQAEHAVSVDASALSGTIEHLKRSLALVESEASVRETELQTQLRTMTSRWKESLRKADELGQSISATSAPLLRQIESLEAETKIREEAWRRERVTLEKEVEKSNSECHVLSQTKSELESSVQLLETRISELQQKLLISENEDEKNDLLRRLKQLEGTLKQSINEKDRELQVMNTENQKLAMLLKSSRIKSSTSRASEKAVMTTTSSSTMTQSSSSLTEDFENKNAALREQLNEKDEIIIELQRSLNDIKVGRGGGESPALSNRTSSSSSLLEINQLRQDLRHKEGENRSLQHQLKSLEASKNHMASEIVKMSGKTAGAEETSKHMQQLKSELTSMRSQHDVLLELLGEKEEQLDELQTEFNEVKQIFQRQIDSLTK